MDKNTVRCIHCGNVFKIESQAEFLSCPQCKTTLPATRLKRYYRSTSNSASQGSAHSKYRTEHTDFLILQGVLERYTGKSHDISLPGGIESIGSKAFMGCSDLINIAIPDGVTVIESEAFSHCPNLTTVILPRTLQRIGDSAFEDCPQLKHIEIPDEVTVIGDLAFSGCKQLSSIRYLSDNKPKTGRNAFQNTPVQTQSAGSSSCYIASCIYGSSESPEVQILRLYRDRTLAGTGFGRAFITCYYAVSPYFVRLFGRQIWFHRIWRRILDREIRKLKRTGKYGL